MRIEYEEAHFMVREMDAYKTHQLAYSLLCKNSSAKRDFVFGCFPVPGRQLICARGKDLPLESTKVSFCVNKNEECRLMVLIPCVRRREICTGGKKIGQAEYVVHEENRSEWFIDLASKHGMDIANENLRLVTSIDRTIVKKKRERDVVGTLFQATVSIANEEAFISALVNGIGRHKNLGFGYIKLLSNDK